jgi:hypothetical protein
MSSKYKTVMMKPHDNVADALTNIDTGAQARGGLSR